LIKYTIAQNVSKENTFKTLSICQKPSMDRNCWLIVFFLYIYSIAYEVIASIARCELNSNMCVRRWINIYDQFKPEVDAKFQFSQQLNDKLPTWKYISTFFSTENKGTVKHVEPLCTSTEEPVISFFFSMHRIYHDIHTFCIYI
jgi:hypothetical protein